MEMSKPKVFISYSRKDEEWKDRIVTHLKAFVHQGDIILWDDRKIGTGADWFAEIANAMAEASIAICLISAHYLGSDFINKEEIPELRRRRQEEGMLLMPILLSPCAWKAIHWLKGIQMFPGDGFSLDEIKPKVQQEKRLSEFAIQIHKRIKAKDFATPITVSALAAPEKVDISRLPQTGAQLFGRKRELQLLDGIWDSGETNVISLVAWGGVGKSTLVNRWLELMGVENYRGAKRVFAWSFYSQGTKERVTSADKFISEALAWFGDADPKKGSPWDKGKRLAELMQQKKTLLILDGLEPLQSGLDFEQGKIKDPALSILVTQIARKNNGLCVITTRENVPELYRFEKTALQPNLDQISKEAGRASLRVGGVQGTDKQLESASEQFGNHALAINLLASYLHDISGHHIKSASAIPDLDIPEEKGRQPRRVIAAFEERFGESPQIQVLRVIGLFDRPAPMDAVKAVRKGTKVSGLTDKIKNLTEGKWHNLLDKLRECKLLAHKSKHNPDIIDCHPLIREHFGEKLQQSNPEGWRKAHGRLYEYYKGVPEKEYPDTLEEMEPLFAAVSHGCQAGRHQVTFHDVYWERIIRKEAFVNDQLGAFGADLAVISCFFEKPWTNPAPGLRDEDKAAVLNYAGFALRALGRLTEAVEPMEAGMELSVKQKNWKNVAINTGNLSELYLTLGEVKKAVDYARQSVEYADKSGNDYTRVDNRTDLADKLHQCGELLEAEKRFVEAESIQKERESTYPFLYSFWNIKLCDLLLTQRKWDSVLVHIDQSEHWMKEYGVLLDNALEKLVLGWAYFLQAVGENRGDYAKSEDFLDQAVYGLREAGTQHHIPRGLLARAELHRVMRDFEKTWADLEEAKEIAERGEMNLFLADYHLEAARLCLAQGGRLEEAREHFEEAAKRVEEMGYHRRDPEVLLIQAELELAEGKKAAAKKTLKAAERRINEMGCHRWDIEVERIKDSV